MRFVIFGVGAIGGTIAVKLAKSGTEVIGITRGAQLEAIRRRGLTLETPNGDEQARFAVYGTPGEVAFRPDDAILLCMKTQDTEPALYQLRDAGVTAQPIVCVQNAVENERLAARIFPNVYGICVMLPASYLEPGIVRAYSVPTVGILDIGRYPSGTDDAAKAIAAGLERAGFSSIADPDIMKAKYGKLLMNLWNVLQAALGPAGRASPYVRVMQEEALAVYKAGGIEHTGAEMDSERRGNSMTIKPVKGELHPGGSSWQSLARGTGSIEIDYFNGEIALLGRLHGVPTPVNAYFQRLASRMIRDGLAPGSIPAEEIERELRSFA
jgi:2-dehydropantoate 2-reductase